MQKLTKKHVLPYVQYGAKMLSKATALGEKDRIWTLEPSHFQNNWNCEFDGKIILRPFSDLFKKINFNGEEIKPIYWIFDNDYKSKVHRYEVKEGYYGTYINIHIYPENSAYLVNQLELTDGHKIEHDSIDYQTMCNLISLQFDVFGLIHEDFAVDINMLHLYNT